MVGRITDTVMQDHRTIEASYTRLLDSSQKDERKRFKNLLAWELSRTLVAKELVVYPALEKRLGEGAALANRARNENHSNKIKEDLKAIQNLDPWSSEFFPTTNRLMSRLKERFADEERNELPKLEAALSGKNSMHLSRSYSIRKVFLPTRAHPSSPSKPPLETLASLMVAPFDQFVDLFRKWPTHA